jgi:uncharacterized membrane protein HdeD (DUF308 family)
MRSYLNRYTAEIIMILLFIVAAVFYFETYLVTFSSVGFFLLVMGYCSLVFSIKKETLNERRNKC